MTTDTTLIQATPTTVPSRPFSCFTSENGPVETLAICSDVLDFLKHHCNAVAGSALNSSSSMTTFQAIGLEVILEGLHEAIESARDTWINQERADIHARAGRKRS